MGLEQVKSESEFCFWQVFLYTRDVEDVFEGKNLRHKKECKDSVSVIQFGMSENSSYIWLVWLHLFT